MPKLQLKKLTCLVTEDGLGPDEPYIKINQQIVWGPGSLNDNQSANLLGVGPISFTGTAQVELFDEDVGLFVIDPPDLLGTNQVSESDEGTKLLSFTGQGAKYQLECEVIADAPLVPFPVFCPPGDPLEQKSGSTHAYVRAKLSLEPDGSGLLEVYVKVKKTGVNGTGFAYGKAVLLDGAANGGNTLYESPIVSKTKGAELDGVANGDTVQSFVISKDVMKHFKKLVVIARPSDNNGLPNDIDEFIAGLKKVKELITAVGDVAAAGAVLVAVFA